MGKIMGWNWGGGHQGLEIRRSAQFSAETRRSGDFQPKCRAQWNEGYMLLTGKDQEVSSPFLQDSRWRTQQIRKTLWKSRTPCIILEEIRPQQGWRTPSKNYQNSVFRDKFSPIPMFRKPLWPPQLAWSITIILLRNLEKMGIIWGNLHSCLYDEKWDDTS